MKTRPAALQALCKIALQAGPQQHAALAPALFTADPDAARAIVRQLAAQPAPLRTLIRAAGWAGDVQVVPWLIKHMADDAHARLAGEAFSFITGADLALLDLERKAPEAAPGGPNEDPQDDNVALDDDESLPWPDAPKVEAWWGAQAGCFAAGTRCFAGHPPSATHCLDVLATHTQRQRIAAAWQLSVLKPGGMLFNCTAPAWRQQRLLATLQGDASPRM